MGLVHYTVNGVLHIVERAGRDEEIIQSKHQSFIEVRNRDIRNKCEEKENQRKECHKEIERHACGTVCCAALSEEFEEINQHIQKRQLGARKANHTQHVVWFAVPL